MPGRVRPSGTRTLAATQILSTAVVAGSVWLFYGAGQAVGLLGIVVGIGAYRAADDRRQDRLLVARLGQLRAGDVAVPAVDLPARSHDPIADGQAILRRGAGVVGTSRGPCVVTAADLRNVSVDRCINAGWGLIARPARTLSAGERLAGLDRLPRPGETWVVLVGGLTFGVLRRSDLVAAANRAPQAATPVGRGDDRRGRGRGRGSGSAADTSDITTPPDDRTRSDPWS